MGIINNYVKTLNALADELRLKILIYLFVNGEKCVCDIGSYFAIGQSSISYHLKILSDAQVITKREVAVWNYYSLTPNSAAYNLLADLFSNIDKKEWLDNE
jgi:ArsR family transcriptional regulator